MKENPAKPKRPGTQQENAEITVAEIREREERKPNLLLFNVDESKCNQKEEIQKEYMTKFMDI